MTKKILAIIGKELGGYLLLNLFVFAVVTFRIPGVQQAYAQNDTNGVMGEIFNYYTNSLPSCLLFEPYNYPQGITEGLCQHVMQGAIIQGVFLAIFPVTLIVILFRVVNLLRSR